MSDLLLSYDQYNVQVTTDLMDRCIPGLGLKFVDEYASFFSFVQVRAESSRLTFVIQSVASLAHERKSVQALLDVLPECCRQFNAF